MCHVVSWPRELYMLNQESHHIMRQKTLYKFLFLAVLIWDERFSSNEYFTLYYWPYRRFNEFILGWSNFHIIFRKCLNWTLFNLNAGSNLKKIREKRQEVLKKGQNHWSHSRPHNLNFQLEQDMKNFLKRNTGNISSVTKT